MISYNYTKIIISNLLQNEIIAAGLIDIQYIDTVADEVNIFFNSSLSEEQQNLLDSVVLVHIGTPVTEVLVEYIDNEEALSSGLKVGDYYRTSEFVKIVY